MAERVPDLPSPQVPSVEVSVLGPVQATVAGQPAALGGPRQRSVLARLVLAGGHVVSTDRLVSEGRAPSRAAVVSRALQRERRRELAARDVAILAAAAGDEDLGALPEHAARTPLDDLD